MGYSYSARQRTEDYLILGLELQHIRIRRSMLTNLKAAEINADNAALPPAISHSAASNDSKTSADHKENFKRSERFAIELLTSS